jgi:hypothetical protein
MKLNPALLATISATHGFSAESNVENFFKKLADSAFIAETKDDRYAEWAAGLLDGLVIFLQLQGHDPLTAHRIRDHIWNEWPRLRA